MPLTPAEIRIRRHLGSTGRSVATLLVYESALALGWTTVRDVAALAGTHPDTAKRALRELIAEGWLDRDAKGPRNEHRLLRYRAKVLEPVGANAPRPVEVNAPPLVGANAFPPVGANAPSAEPSIAHSQRTRASDPDLSLTGSSQDSTVRPSGEGVQGEPADRRTDGRRELRDRGEQPAGLTNALVERVCRRWQLGPRQVTPGLTRLLNVGLTVRELWTFLEDAHRGTHPAFAGVDPDRRFGTSCTVERLEVWRRTREPKRQPTVSDTRPRPPRPEVEGVTYAQIVADVERVMRGARGGN